MNKWEKIVNLINQKNKDDVVTRKELLVLCNETKKRAVTTTDNYRSWLCKCGVLKVVEPGIYIVKKHFKDKNMPVSKIRTLIYKDPSWMKWFVEPDYFKEAPK